MGAAGAGYCPTPSQPACPPPDSVMPLDLPIMWQRRITPGCQPTREVDNLAAPRCCQLRRRIPTAPAMGTGGHNRHISRDTLLELHGGRGGGEARGGTSHVGSCSSCRMPWVQASKSKSAWAAKGAAGLQASRAHHLLIAVLGCYQAVLWQGSTPRGNSCSLAPCLCICCAATACPVQSTLRPLLLPAHSGPPVGTPGLLLPAGWLLAGVAPWDAVRAGRHAAWYLAGCP